MNNKSGGNVAMLTLRDQEKDSVAQADWEMWPAPDVDAAMQTSAPWLVAVLRRCLRAGVNKTPARHADGRVRNGTSSARVSCHRIARRKG